ncbi:hypothetical protein [Bacillus cereus]|uniref:hypothetical protein n=1 Tax=Bacillus cereus TaxID=1396 RepID=UPI000BF40C82|nr:hypothetical protein [Bacillus cereus]PFI74702.1 hypothetical protein COI83_30510 [Bacillus cereus]
MSSLSIAEMKDFLSKSYSSYNQNKLNGLLAEVDFRNYISSLGYADRISIGGWIARSVRNNSFGQKIIAIFPETIDPNQVYPTGRVLPTPQVGLHTICSTLHSIGIESYFCSPVIGIVDDPESISWNAVQLGLPTQQNYSSFPNCFNNTSFVPRERRYNFLRYNSDVSNIPSSVIPEEFAKEHLRITFQNKFFAELSDIDGIFWGNQNTYPLEIKEKTAGNDPDIGEYFGLDIGPYVKLSSFAALRNGNLNSIFVVREIDSIENRRLLNWWYIPFESIARFASWVPRSGGASMNGGRSAVIRIPKNQFKLLNSTALSTL